MSEFETQVQDVAANETTSEETVAMTAEQESDFENAFDGKEDVEAAEEPKAEESVKEEPTKEEPTKISVGDREYTPQDVEGLLNRVTELQGAANTIPPERTLIERLAAQSGMDVDAFVEQAESVIMDGKIAAREQQLLEQGLNADMARHVAETEVKNAVNENMLKASQAKTTSAQSRQEALKEKFDRDLKDFYERYPDVKEPPDEVLDEIAKTGCTPVVAYQNHLIREKDKEIAALRQEHKNKEQSMGSVKGGKPQAQDDFLTGFDSALE